MLLQNLYVLFSINGAFTDVTVIHDAMGTNTTPSEIETFEHGTGNNLDGHFPH